MEIDIELKLVDDRVYLNFWDWAHGRDVNCQVEDGKLMKFVHSASENEELELQQADYDPFEKEEITLERFIELVSERAKSNLDEYS